MLKDLVELDGAEEVEDSLIPKMISLDDKGLKFGFDVSEYFLKVNDPIGLNSTVLQRHFGEGGIWSQTVSQIL